MNKGHNVLPITFKNAKYITVKVNFLYKDNGYLIL